VCVCVCGVWCEYIWMVERERDTHFYSSYR
jgi:hypothetical protein